MSYYITVRPFYKAKNDQAWDEIIKGEFTKKLEKEITQIEKKLSELNKNPDIKYDFNLHMSEESRERRKRLLKSIIDNIPTLKDAFKNNNQQSINEYINCIDSELTDYYSEIDYFDSRYPFHEFFSALFEIVLNEKIDEKWEHSLCLLPTDLWIKLFKQISPEALKEAIAMVDDEPDDKETQQYYFQLAKTISNILKDCKENQGEIHISDEAYYSGLGKDDKNNSLAGKRVEEIYKRLKEVKF